MRGICISYIIKPSTGKLVLGREKFIIIIIGKIIIGESCSLPPHPWNTIPAPPAWEPLSRGSESPVTAFSIAVVCLPWAPAPILLNAPHVGRTS